MSGASSKLVIRVLLNGVPIAGVAVEEIPVEKRVSFKLDLPHSVLSFQDSLGVSYNHSLNFESGWIHLSVRVHPNLACQSDCLVSESKMISDGDLNNGRSRGIRFQPIYLPGSKGNASELHGRGLFFRGLHFAGAVTPGNVSLACICDACRRSFRLQSFHAGLGNCGYFYSDSGVQTLVVDNHIEGCPPAMGKPNIQTLETLEARLPKSTKDGTAFRYFNSLRCPHCKAAFIDFQKFPKERETEYYGNCFYDEKPEHFAGP